MNPKQKGQKGVKKFISVLIRHSREKFFQTPVQNIKSSRVGLFKIHQIFYPAVDLHIINVHGHQLQHTAAFLQDPGQNLSKGFRIHSSIPVYHFLHVCNPGIVFPFQKRQKDFFLRLKIIIDRCPGKRSLFSNIPDRDILETHGLIEGGAGAYDFFFPRIR